MESIMTIEAFDSFLADEQKDTVLHRVLRQLTGESDSEKLRLLLSQPWPGPDGGDTRWGGWNW